MHKRAIPACICLLLLVITGCSGEPSSGPVEVKWDRNQCERCRMVVSDRKYAAQARQPLSEGRSKVFHFDDIGCAVIWLEEQEWRNDSRAELWVTDFHTGKWIDARSASYIPGQITPMGYGLGAQAGAAADGLNFNRAVAHILDTERRLNRHGAGHEHEPAAAGNREEGVR